MDRCYLMTRSYSACIQGLGSGPNFDFSPLGIDNPASAPNSHFYISGYGAALLPAQQYHFMVGRNDHELLIPDPGTLNLLVCPNGYGSGTFKSQIALCVTETSIKIIGSGFYEGI